MIDLGPRGASDSVATALNDMGQVVGSYRNAPDGHEHAFSWTAMRGLVDLGTLGGTFSSATAVNDAGAVVGWSVPRDDDSHHAFLWTAAQGMIDLGTLGGRYSLADRINDVGQIIGWSDTATGGRHAVLWDSTTLLEPLHVTTPNSPSKWGLNTRHRLAWTYDGNAAQFQIEISRNRGRTWDYLTTVANEPGGSQDFFWQVTGPLAFASRFRVSAIGDPDATDVNDANIRIAGATIEMLRPTEETSVAVGAPLTIFYKHSLGARAPVAIDISSNNGTTWRTVAETKTTGSHTSSFRWVVDLPPVRRARVRIRALDGSGARDVSRAFAVTATIGRNLEWGWERESSAFGPSQP
jgi:probable HAF family extracellular repeat protein